VALFGLFKHIHLLPHCGKLSSLSGTSFLSIVGTQRRAYPWWVSGLLLLARSFAMHITSFDRLDQLSHGIRWFGNGGPYLSTVSFSSWLSWANFEHMTDWGSSLLILLVFSAGMAWNLILICFLLVSGWVVNLWDRIKSWLRIGKRMFTLNNKPGFSRNYLLFHSKLAFTWLYSSLPRKESRKAWNFYPGAEKSIFRIKSLNRWWNRDFMRFHLILTILPDFDLILPIFEFYKRFST
jgi:hypothetical protein